MCAQVAQWRIDIYKYHFVVDIKVGRVAEKQAHNNIYDDVYLQMLNTT